MRRLVDSADVLIENFRPGTLERLGLDPVELLERNPGLVVLRITGFGQDGPYAARPGFATMAEAMSGFAAINGEPDGAPLLPPIALTDEVTALAGAFTVMVALRHRDATGEGQVVDLNLLETMLQLMGALPSANAHLGYLQPRLGSGIPYTVPRGTYQCADGRWIAISTSAESIAHRVMELLGVGDDPRFATFDGRVEHRVELDRIVADWVGARPSEEVLARFEAAEAAIAPVYSMADLLADPHIAAREAMVEVDGVRMPGLLARLSKTPGEVRHAGRPLGADTDEVVADLWLDHAGRGAGTRDAPRSVGVETPPLRRGPQRLLGTSLASILHHDPRVFQSLLWTTLWTNRWIWGGRRPDLSLDLYVFRRQCGELTERRGSGPVPVDGGEMPPFPLRVGCATNGDRAGGGVVSQVTNEELLEAVRGQTVPTRFAETVRATPDAVALRWKDGDTWHHWTWTDYAERATRLAASLRDLGVGRGDRVVLMMRNRPEFHVADMATLLLGATPISIYNSSAAEQVQYLVGHCEASVAILEDDGYLERFQAVRAELPKLEHVITIEAAGGRPADVLAWDVLLEAVPLDLRRPRPPRSPRTSRPSSTRRGRPVHRRVSCSTT